LAFVLNGLVFVLIGLQLPYVLGAIRGGNLRNLILYGLAFSGLLILLRLIWMFPGAYLANVIRNRVLRQKESVPPARHIFIVGWTGMRGVVSLAAAIALPQTLANGSPFVQRNTIIFLAFCVILVTLVLQGLTLPSLIRALGVAGDGKGPHPEEREARRAILQAAIDHLEEAKPKDDPEAAEIYDDLAQHYRGRLMTVAESVDGSTDGISPNFYSRYIEVSRQLLQVERQTAVQLRNSGRIGDDLLRQIEHELDLGEARLKSKSD
jgi:monovalent cation/hydrogen antiporter